MRDPYEVLGVSPNDDERTIRKAYKRLAVAHHPDRSRHPDAAERFKQVTEAYAILTDETARARYERWRTYERRTSSRPRPSPAAQGYDPQAAYARAAERYRTRSASWTATYQTWHSQPPKPTPKPTRGDAAAIWVGNIAAILLMGIYVWRSSVALPLQPWLPAPPFATHGLSSPIWITLSLGLTMILFPKWYLVPILVEERRSVRLTGWIFLLLFPLLSAWLLTLSPHFQLVHGSGSGTFFG